MFSQSTPLHVSAARQLQRKPAHHLPALMTLGIVGAIVGLGKSTLDMHSSMSPNGHDRLTKHKGGARCQAAQQASPARSPPAAP